MPGVIGAHWLEDEGRGVVLADVGKEDVEVLVAMRRQQLDVLEARHGSQDGGDVITVSVSTPHYSSPREGRHQGVQGGHNMVGHFTLLSLLWGAVKCKGYNFFD